MPQQRHINKAIVKLSSHPSRKSLCFDSKLVVVGVVIGLMETRLKYCYKLCIQSHMAVTRIFYFMLCQSSLLSTVISFAYKDKLWFDETMSVIFCMENT